MNPTNEPWEQGGAENSASSSLFIQHIALPTLKEMTSYRVALSIWTSYISSHSKFNEIKEEEGDSFIRAFGIGCKFWEEYIEIIESLETPVSVKELLKSTAESVCFEAERFKNYINFKVFYKLDHQYQIEQYDVNWFVWLANGEIDRAKTASKMLSAPGFSLELRFAIMSTLCMEEEIKKFPWRSLSDSFITQLTFDNNGLMYYWICYLKNELNKIPLGGLNSLDAVMALKCDYDNYTAFEYFWCRLGDEDQILVAKGLINSRFGYSLELLYAMFRQQHDKTVFEKANRLLIRAFSTMSSQQQHRLLSEVPDRLLVNFWITAFSPESAMWIWKNFKHLITPEQFSEIVRQVFKWEVYEHNGLNVTFGVRQSYPKVPFYDGLRLFLEIWHSASDEQKSHVTQTMENEIIKPFLRADDHPRAAFEFLYAFLSMKSEEERRQVILRNAAKLGSKIKDPNSMNEIIQLCLPEPADQLRYKRLIMESAAMRFRARRLFNDGNIDQLIHKLKCFATDATIAVQFLNWLMKSKHTEKRPYLTEVQKWNKFSQFLNELFSQDFTSELYFKKEFIISYAQGCRYDWNDDCLDQTSKIIDSVFTNNEELQVVKKYFLDSFRNLFLNFAYWRRFEEKYFNKFVSWCLNGDEGAVIEFIKNVPLDAIVDKYFKGLEYWYEDGEDEDEDDDYSSVEKLQDLEKCVRWYFKSIEGVRQYKLKRLNAFKESKLFYLILEHEDQLFLDIVLNWLFDGDEESMLKFKKEKVEVVLGEVRNQFRV